VSNNKKQATMKPPSSKWRNTDFSASVRTVSLRLRKHKPRLKS